MKRFLPVLLLLMSGLVAAGGANAAGTITFTETGGNVVVTFSGTINTTALTPTGFTSPYATVIWPSLAAVNIGDITGTNCTEYSGITGPTSWGTGGFTPTSSATGNTVAILGSTGNLCLPIGYTAGNLNGTSTYNGTTIATLGFTVGTYTYTWGSGATADSINLYIGTSPTPAPSAVPTLSEWAQLMLALMVIGVAWHFHNKDQNSY